MAAARIVSLVAAVALLAACGDSSSPATTSTAPAPSVTGKLKEAAHDAGSAAVKVGEATKIGLEKLKPHLDTATDKTRDALHTAATWAADKTTTPPATAPAPSTEPATQP